MSERDLIDELLQAKVKTQLFGGQHAPRLGRLVILEPLGSGGMGTVFCAYDPRLERKVAVKLVRGGGDSSTRVLREARALGKLNHPNVVAVYDATENDGVIAIVMELAPGEPLRRWVGAKKPWRDVVRVMREAAEGLAAAHRAGVVHRDVKPDNIVIGPDRARLVDFGLASSSASGPSLGEDAGVESSDSLEGSGTPSYMAPEVLAGKPADAASDQFSFGVTLFEALHGVRPHHAKTRRELETAARRAGSVPAPADSDLPAWLQRVVGRALAPEPGARFESMDQLAIELGRARLRKRQALFAALAAVVLTLSAVGVGYQRGAERDLCGDGRARVEATWSAPRIEALRASLGSAPWSRKAADDFVALTRAWEQSHRRVCEATRARGGQPESLLELRMRCLDRRFDRLTALGTALSGSLEPESRENVSSAIAALPRPERCESLVDAADLALPDDPAERSRVRVAERELDRAWAAYVLGRYGEAREIATAVDTSTRELHAPAFRATLLLLLGSVEARLGTAASARPRLESALREAADARAPEVEVEAWVRLLRSELFDGNPAHVVEWAPFARVAAVRAESVGAEIDGIEAEARRDAGELGEARTLLTRALSSRDALRGDQRALLEMNLGSVELASGKPIAAEAAFSRALGLAEAALGAGHPGLGLYFDKLATAARERGRISEALSRHDRALELRRAVYGASDRSVATTLLRRAQSRIEAGRLRDAEIDLNRAREIRVEVHGPNHRRLAEIDLALGDAAAARGDRAKASASYQSAKRLDPQLDLTARLAEVGGAIEPSELRSRPNESELSLEGSKRAAQYVERLQATGQHEAAARETDRLVAARRAAGQGVAAAVSIAVARAEHVIGHDDRALAAYDDALAALAEEPSITRLRALQGIAECARGERARSAAAAALRLLDAMPELDPSHRARLGRTVAR